MPTDSPPTVRTVCADEYNMARFALQENSSSSPTSETARDADKRPTERVSEKPKEGKRLQQKKRIQKTPEMEVENNELKMRLQKVFSIFVTPYTHN